MSTQTKQSTRDHQLNPKQLSTTKEQQFNPKQLPTPIQKYYFDDQQTKKIIKQELLDKYPQELAQKFVNQKIELSTSQMRRFYDEIKAIERSILRESDQEEAFKKRQPSLHLLKAKAVYSYKRKAAPYDFVQFIFDHVESIKDVHDFKAFVKIFEAVVAYHKFYSDDK